MWMRKMLRANHLGYGMRIWEEQSSGIATCLQEWHYIQRYLERRNFFLLNIENSYELELMNHLLQMKAPWAKPGKAPHNALMRCDNSQKRALQKWMEPPYAKKIAWEQQKNTKSPKKYRGGWTPPITHQFPSNTVFSIFRIGFAVHRTILRSLSVFAHVLQRENAPIHCQTCAVR